MLKVPAACRVPIRGITIGVGIATVVGNISHHRIIEVQYVMKKWPGGGRCRDLPKVCHTYKL